MSKPTRWSLVYAVCVVALLVLAIACATGGQSGTGDAAVDTTGTVKMDGSVIVNMDSNISTLPDAKTDGSIVVQDAFVQPDAPPNSLFCQTNSQCTMAGQCCFAINGQGFCVNGTVILNVCFPQ